jgi:hypothetical protein
MSDQIPSSAETRSAHTILSQHKLKRNVKRRVFLLLTFSLLTVLGALLWSVYRWYFAFTRFGPAVVWRWSGPAIGISFLALLLALYAGLFLLRYRRRYMYTTSDGLWFVTGDTRRSIRWPQIASIQNTASKYIWSQPDSGPHMRILLTTIEGETIRIPSFLTAIDEANQIIKANIYPLAMNRYREMMNSGQPLEFGPLQLTSNGVMYRNRMEPWQHFREVRMERGQIMIEFAHPSGNKRISFSARRVPNIDLCVQLLRNIEY